MNALPTLVLGLFVSVTSFADSAAVPVNQEIFFVVSPATGSEKFYLKMNRLGARKEASHVREDVICAAILKSQFFSTDNDVEIVDPADLREYARFHHDLHEWHMFGRPYEWVNVSISEDVTRQEPVFPCLVEFKEPNVRKMYFVSHEYDFNKWITRHKTKCPEVTGRFIFEYNKSKKMAQLTAVAEEPACRLDYYAVDYGHYRSLQDDLSRISKRGQEICEYRTGRKIRICAIGLNAKGYRHTIKFLPIESSIEPRCEKRELFFGHSFRSFKFSEWVMGCEAELVGGKGARATYFMSLGYEPYQFLIYHPQENSNVSILKHHFYSHLGANNHDYFRD